MARLRHPGHEGLDDVSVVHYLTQRSVSVGRRNPACNVSTKVGIASRRLTSERSKVTCSKCWQTYDFKEKR